jgi:hypothetical protein
MIPPAFDCQPDVVTSDFHQDRFGFGVQLNTIACLLAPDAALLESAERQGRIDQMVTIHPHRARLDPLRQSMCEAEVLRPDTGGQTVIRIVRLRRDLIRIAVAVGDQDGTKDLFLV